MEIVINSCYGGFSLSPEGVRRYAELSGFKVWAYQTDFESKNHNETIRWSETDSSACIYWIKEDLGDRTTDDKLNKADWFHDTKIDRADEKLIQVVKELKGKANGDCASLKIVEIPDGTDYVIEEYDGSEQIAEKHKIWY